MKTAVSSPLLGSDQDQIKLPEKGKEPLPPSTLNLDEATPKLQRQFRVLIGQATHLGFLEGGGMYLNEEDKRKSRYVPTERGIDALKGCQGEEDQRLLLDIAALYQELKDRRAEPEDRTNGRLPYGLAALREEMERREIYLKEHQLEKISGANGLSGDITEPTGNKEIPTKPGIMEDKQKLKPDFDIAREAVAKLPREQQLALVEEFAPKTQKPEQAQAQEKPDISHIPLWGGKIKDGSALEWLETHYGQYLTTCGAPQNLLYRQDINAHDPSLLVGITTELRTTKDPSYKGKKQRDFVPIKTNEVDDRAKRQGFDEKGRPVTGPAKEVARTSGTLQSRKHRQKHAEAPASAHS